MYEVRHDGDVRVLSDAGRGGQRRPHHDAGICHERHRPIHGSATDVLSTSSISGQPRLRVRRRLCAGDGSPRLYARLPARSPSYERSLRATRRTAVRVRVPWRLTCPAPACGCNRHVRRTGVLSLPRRVAPSSSFYGRYKRHVEDPFWALRGAIPRSSRRPHSRRRRNIGYTAGVFAAANFSPGSRCWHSSRRREFIICSASDRAAGAGKCDLARRAGTPIAPGRWILVLNPNHPGDSTTWRRLRRRRGSRRRRRARTGDHGRRKAVRSAGASQSPSSDRRAGLRAARLPRHDRNARGNRRRSSGNMRRTRSGSTVDPEGISRFLRRAVTPGTA